MLQNSIFGYIVSGSLTAKSENNVYCGLVTDNYDLEKTVKSFWEIENIERESEISKSKELKICEADFQENYSRSDSGQYIVKMPLKENPACLGESKNRALKSLNSLWNKLEKQPNFEELYRKFMLEYIELGHMEEIREEDKPAISYYIPHNCVIRKESKTTPLRVVFNASALSSTGKSLNCLQYNGGTIQEDLFNIMVRFRQHQYVFVSDIKKMYRMIWIHPSQQDLLRILFKPNINEPVKEFRLKTVTYGTTSASFLATRCIKQLVTDEGDKFPLASSVLLRDIYMDDILTGDENLEKVKEIQIQLISLLKRAGMALHKWAANHQSLLQGDSEIEYEFTGETKTLGILWKPKQDCFGFNLMVEENDTYTKRDVLSQIAKIFDPLGLVGPIIARAKIFLQKLWLLKIEWNDPLPPAENREWEEFINGLKTVNTISVPRCVLLENYCEIELHGFADASQLAYGSVIYIKSINDHGDSAVKLLTSKSRVAPLKCVTIPRLELCAAVLLTKLMTKVISALSLKVNTTYFYSDSTIVLAWLKREPSDLKTFVANRVAAIQTSSNIEQWNHVPSTQNPADLISRGYDSNKLKESDLWWCGPSFLQQPKTAECYNTDVDTETNELFLNELKGSCAQEVCTLLSVSDPLDFIVNCSSFIKMKRVIAWCRRFAHNALNPLHKSTGSLTSEELKQSLLCIVKCVQKTAFSYEINCLKKNIPLKTDSKLLNLAPFLSDGILRVGGRLQNSTLSETQKHPIILPTYHNFTICVINHYHSFYFHTGAELTLNLIRSMFWILSGRNVIRKVIFQCLICQKIKAKPQSQFMANLPASRVTVTRVFNRTGLDYCGPFEVKNFTGRNRQVKKIFVCVFVCFTVKAVHFEIANDLTSAAFLAALKRFIARRGKPADIYSDNGRNFVGANKELKDILKSLFSDNDEVKFKSYLAQEGINWHFNPPATPHFGGLWESSVKSLKYHLKRVVGQTILSYEEFLTLTVQIEAVLNSRPLCPISNDPNDVEALTPAHFLIGSSLMALPELNYTETPMNRLTRWQLVQKLTQHLWKKWSSEYLNKLLQRPKWHRGKTEIKIGDLVLVKEPDNYTPLRWHLARIVQIHPGQDDIVRIVTLKDKNGTYKRPVTKIVTLPYINSNLS